ncbi:MAG: hypothetical protein CL596_02160 [Alteromonas sp.]|nr:hypothetical protein [Alteromonas sp.]MAY22497.1 hypothetical protein [Flavobacteriaceae bacterium]|tara:strand:+ start:21592 stop:21810 length:219 start_codon:yes stop_codon:yes gene_type:complete
MGKRLCIYASDVELITGRSNRQSLEILRKIKLEKGKETHQVISYCEFAEYMGLKPEAVLKTINKVPLVLEEE